MEMSPYRLPAAGRVGMIVWTNMRSFMARIATVVFGLTVIVWLMSNFTVAFKFVPDNPGSISVMRHIGGLAAWIFAPLGFGNWQAATALLSGFIAKEAVISSLQSIAENGDVAAVLNNNILSAVSFTVFVLLYVPCVSAVGAIRRELGRKLMWVSVFMQLGVAYIVSFMVYWTGRLVTSGNTGLIIAIIVSALIIVTAAIVFCKTRVYRILLRKGRQNAKN